ncbi:hypothetical protein [Poriferisphaera sp. WC338]|uniref:hypothetical protein n=1 Tax=Poriferisphaera sp. WC338 TaxID=3425129 RepID=UPI003D8143AA
MQHMQPGQPIRNIDARTWNAMVNTARVKEQQENSITSQAGVSPQSTDIIRIKNDSNIDLNKHDVLGITDKLFHGNHNDIALTGTIPDKLNHTTRFAILTEPIKAGRIGKAIISGITPTKIFITNEMHTHADIRHIPDQQTPVPSNTPQPCRFESTFNGVAQILYKDGRTVTVTGLNEADGEYIEHEEGVFTNSVKKLFTLEGSGSSWSIKNSGSTISSSSSEGNDGYPPLDGWTADASVKKAARNAVVRLGNGPAMVPMTAKQQRSALMQAVLKSKGVDLDLDTVEMINQLLLHFHDDSTAPIAWNDVQAIQTYNETHNANLTVPLIATEGYNHHGHTSQFDGGYIPGMGPHDHRDNFNGGYAFAVYHPGASLPQQPWAL